MRKMRGFSYNGSKIELYNNHIYGFRFEYKIKPYNPHNFRFALTGRFGGKKEKRKIAKVIHDPSSMRYLKGAKYYAKQHAEFFRTRAQLMRF